MMPESEMLFAVVQFEEAGRHTVRRVVAPFPDRSAAATFATDNDLRHFTVGPMAFAVPTSIPFDGPPRATTRPRDLPAPRDAPT
ncbi:hypothetical protein CcI49_16785 [Frankia sp. CcI49]|uniref:hypothetical protein n=1 Tax=unclassified Frankia TaxID=2632575 RepID=UPI0006CA4602|nr:MULTISPECIES: hypothetical protein [unclassified Frankia]KPM53299.1 hypothetical protein ACG83_21350 [Frankia sp. R43]ONH59609.1 hypothetical protein CcI49_16785 [Frankia sp. CcI49]